MRKLISLFLMICMVLSLFSSINSSVWAAVKTGDDGTINSDFIEPVTHQETVPNGYIGIYTVQDLDNVRNNLSNNYILMADIDLSSKTSWDPIGSGSSFTGVFDGNGYKILNLSVGTNYRGFWGYNSGIIKNVALENFCVINNSASDTGGLVGNYNRGTIYNCYFSGSFTGVFAGGIANTNRGLIDSCATFGEITGIGVGAISCSNYGKIINCINKALIIGDATEIGHSISTSITSGISLGGITRSMGTSTGTARSEIVNCINYGDIIDSPENKNNESNLTKSEVGGIVAELSVGTIKNCINKGTITSLYGNAGNYVRIAGGVAGWNNGGVIEMCYNAGAIYGDKATGGIAGLNSDSVNGDRCSINNCYNIGVINGGTGSTGGIVGRGTNYGLSPASVQGTVENCYNAGSIINTYTNSAKGIVGTEGRTPVNCHYLSGVVNGGNDSRNTIGVKSLSVVEMRQPSSFIGYDFNTVWGIGTGVNSGYPHLKNLLTEQQDNTSGLLIYLECNDEFIYENGKMITKQVPIKIKVKNSNISTESIQNINVDIYLSSGFSLNQNITIDIDNYVIGNLSPEQTDTHDITIYSNELNGETKYNIMVCAYTDDGQYYVEERLSKDIRMDKWEFPNFKEEVPYEYYTYLWGDSLRSWFLYEIEGRANGRKGSGGLCHGIAAVNALLKDNLPSLQSFVHGAQYANYISDIKKDDIESYKSKILGNLSVKEYIFIMFLTQKISLHEEQSEKTKNKYDDLYNKVKNYQNTGNNPILIGITGELIGEGKGKHILFPIRVEDDQDRLTSRIYVYDSNKPSSERFITLHRNSVGASFSSCSYPDWTIKDISYNEEFDLWYYLLLDPNAEKPDKDLAILITDNSNSYSISDKQGGTASFANGELINSELNIIEMNNNFSGEDAEDDIKAIYIPYGEYSITGASDNDRTTSLLSFHKKVEVTTVESSTVTMNVSDENDNNNYAIINSNGQNKNFSILYEQDSEIHSLYNGILISGSANGTVETHEENDNIHFNGSDSIVITVTSDDKTITKKINNINNYECVSISVASESGDEFLVVKGDSDGTGNFDELIDKTPLEQTSMNNKIIGYTTFSPVNLNTDEHIVTLEQLKDSGNLPTNVTVTDGAIPATAEITDWNGYFDGAETGTYTLTAVWEMPDGYINGSVLITVTITIDVSVEQTAINLPPTVDAVVVLPDNISLNKGNTYRFTAQVQGTNNPPQDVDWTILGGIYDTTITSGGVLTISPNESAQTLTVMATSQLADTIYGTSSVTVLESSPTFNKLMVSSSGGGTAYILGGATNGDFVADSIINIVAKANYNNKFVGWSTSNGGIFGNASLPSTTFVMPLNETTITANFSTSSSGSSSSSSGGGGGSSSSSGSTTSGAKIPTAQLPSYVVSGTWIQATGQKWLFTKDGRAFTNEWAAVHNPYANINAGNPVFDWFYFNKEGYMQMGWFADADGNVYYLHTVSDGTLGHMYTGWHWIDERCYYFNPISDGTKGKLFRNCTTPDGYTVNGDGQWVVNGVVQTK